MKEKIKINCSFISLLTFGFIIMIISAIIIAVYNPNSDVPFLIENGRYIFENRKLADVSYWTIDETPVVIHQWLCSLLNYIAYRQFGFFGTKLLAFLFFTVFLFTEYKYVSLFVSDKKIKFFSILLTFAVGVTVLSSRPMPVSFSIQLFLLIACEVYYNAPNTNKNRLILYLELFLAGIMQSNWHASHLIMLFAFLSVYIFSNFWLFVKSSNLSDRDIIYKNKILDYLVGMIPLFIGGMLNPNGLKAYTFLMDSKYAISKIGFYIVELQPLSVRTSYFYIWVALLIFSVIYFMKMNKTEFVDKFRFLLLSSGCLIVALPNVRNIIYIVPILLTIVPMFIESHFDITERYEDSLKLTKNKILITITGVICFCISVAVFALAKDDTVMFKKLYPIMEYMNANANKNDNIYTDFDSGNYFLLNGYVNYYLDARPESYCGEITGAKRYESKLEEYMYIEQYNCTKSKFNLPDGVHNLYDYIPYFLEKYDFDYICVKSDKPLDIYLLSNGYEKVDLSDENAKYGIKDEVYHLYKM